MATIDTIANEVYQRHLLKGVQVAPAEKEVNQESLMKRPQVEQEPEQDAATAKNVVLNFIDALSNDVYDSNIIDTAVRESSTDVQMGSDKMYGMYKTPVHIFQAMNRDVDPDTAEMYVRETPQLDYLNRLDIDTRENEMELQEYRRMVAGDTEFAFPTAARQVSSRIKIPKLEVSEEPDVTIKDAPDADIVLDEPTPTRTEGLGSRPVAEAQTDDDMGLPESRSTEEQSVAAEQYLNENLYSTDAPINVSNMQISGNNFSDRNNAIDEVARGLSNTYTDEEVAALKATIARESGIGLIEGTNYSRDVAIAKLGNNNTTRIAEINALFDRSNAGDRLDASQQEELINIAYGGRMGNANNEGYKYRGRGLIQITGKNHYRDVSERLGLGDLLVTNPELVATDPAIMVAATKAYLDMKGFGSDSLSANSLKDTIGHSGGAREAETRWANTIEDLRNQGKDDLADELVLNNEFAAQRKAGATVDGDIGPRSIAAFEEWLTKAGISFSEDMENLELVRLVNSN